MHAAGTSAVTRSIVFLTAWMLMTAAMMLPSAMPLLVSLDRIARGQPGRSEIPAVAAFAYLAVWGLVGVAACVGRLVATDVDADGRTDVVVLPGDGDPSRVEPPLVLRSLGAGRFAVEPATAR